MFEDIFLRKKLNKDKLEEYGFLKKENNWIYETYMMENVFRLEVKISNNEKVTTDLTEKDSNEPYILYKTNSEGLYVGKVRLEIEKVLQDIADKCFDSSLFKSEQSLEVIDYIKEKYQDELEFLWEKFPDNAIWRRKDNRKWYGIITKISKRKLGLKDDEIVEIIDLRLNPQEREMIIDNENYFPGWHMNKKSWYTIIMDNSVTTKEIYQRIDESYRLAKSNKTKV